MSPSKYFVLLEAVGKQAFIFGSNKLRQNLGASQMILEATTTVLDDCLAESGYRLGHVESEHHDAEVVVRTSGKAMLVCRSREVAEGIVWGVTSRCLARLPGVRVVGAIEEFEWGAGIGSASAAAHRRLDQVRARTDFIRFQGLPLGEPCALSDQPAALRLRRDGVAAPMSHAAMAKDQARDRALERLGRLAPEAEATARVFDEMEMSWVAVVHADGNGLGAVFSDFDSALAAAGGGVDDRAWVDEFGALSRAVEEVTEAAYRAAVQDGDAIVPVVLGGDDLTAICAGHDAWGFSRRYMHTFAELAAENDVIARLLPTALTASAGVAVVKRHFPFSDAYRLAEELVSSAKRLKPAPAIDVHVLYDSATSALAALRGPACRGAWRSVGPFVLDPRPVEAVGEGAEPADGTLDMTGVDLLVAALQRTDEDGRRLLPRSQVHTVRLACERDPGLAQREWTRLRSMLASEAQIGLPESLRASRSDGAEGTVLYDALALADVGSEGGS